MKRLTVSKVSVASVSSCAMRLSCARCSSATSWRSSATFIRNIFVPCSGACRVPRVPVTSCHLDLGHTSTTEVSRIFEGSWTLAFLLTGTVPRDGLIAKQRCASVGPAGVGPSDAALVLPLASAVSEGVGEQGCNMV